jgi:hypothetical protein
MLIANLNTHYHFNYHQLEMAMNKTIAIELNSQEK